MNKLTNFFPGLVDPYFHNTPLYLEGGELRSKEGGKYKIIHNIPRILPEMSNYADAFGQQWNRWKKTQLDSYTQTTISAERINRCLGKELVDMLGCKKVLDVLEAGCGAGRFTEILLGYPEQRVTSIDLSSAVEANQDNCPQNEYHRIIQCDICSPPFAADSYDIVVCLGVIQHTPNPELTIERLFNQVKPGGSLVIDHYAPNIKRFTKITSLLIRPVLKRASVKTRMSICEDLVNFFLPIHRVFGKFPLGQQLISRFSPLATYYHVYPQLTEDLQRSWALLDTHDALTDWYKHLRTPAQIKSFLIKLGAIEVQVSEGGNGVEARCKKPLA